MTNRYQLQHPQTGETQTATSAKQRDELLDRGFVELDPDGNVPGSPSPTPEHLSNQNPDT